MKNQCYKLFVFCLFWANFVHAQNYPLNGGFENWTGNLPDHWTTLSGSGPIFQGSPYSGLHSATLGMVYDGIIDWWGGAITQTDTNAFKPIAVSGSWSGTTYVRVKVEVYDASNNIIGSMDSTSNISGSNWSNFGFPINYTSAALPYRTQISIVNMGATQNNACNIDSVTFIYLPAATIEQGSTESLIVYPNPAKDKIYIKAQENGKLKLYNALGALVKTIALFKGENVVEVSGFNPGMYVLLLSESNRIAVSKLMIQ